MLSRFFLCILTLLLSTLIIAQNDLASEKAYLGVTYHHVSEEKAKKLNFETTRGAFVSFITEGSAAQKAGLQAFDYIIAMNDEEFTKEKSFRTIMDDFKPGQNVEITVIRKGESQNLIAQLTERPSQTRNMYQDDNAFLGVSPSHDEVPEEIIGARVSHITDGSTADMIGMRDDDIILTINDNPIVDWNDLGTALDNTPTGEELNIVFYRESSDKIYDRWAMAVNHGDKPQIIEEFEPDTGFLSLDQMEDITVVKVEEENTTTTISAPGTYVLVENSGSEEYSNMEYPEVILETENYVIVREDMIDDEIDTFEITDNIAVNADKILDEMDELNNDEDLQMIDFKNVRRTEAEDMKEELDIEMPIDNSLDVNSLNLYPNPNDGIFSLNFESAIEGDIEVKVYTSDGRLVYNEIKGDFSGLFIQDINIQGNSRGVYFLMIRQGDQTFSKKFIVQ